jgi:RNA polymerase sigma factor (sigma-70 family)
MKQQAERWARLRELPIQYVHSREFERPDLAETILLPWTAEKVPHAHAPADTPPYLAALYEIPLLTRDQEFHLFRQMNFHLHLAAKLQQRLKKRGSDAVADELEHHLAQARALRNAIVQANLRLVVSIAKMLVDPANTLDELISEGNVPLIRAVEIFDFTRGLRFSTYATWAIRNCLFRCTPKNRKQQKRFVTGVADSLSQARDRKETVGTSERQWETMRSTVARLLDELAPRERTIVAARFGLESEPRSARLHEIAGRMDLSTERVRQLLSRALGRMRTVAEKTVGEVAS